jgi:hypothetical protein
MAILVCQECDNEQEFSNQSENVEYNEQGRITREDGWVFDPETGRCIVEESESKGSGWQCFACLYVTLLSYHMPYTSRTEFANVYNNVRPPSMWVHSWVPPEPEVILEENPEPVWSVLPGGSTCQCTDGCDDIIGCKCGKDGYACSIMCKCRGR